MRGKPNSKVVFRPRSTKFSLPSTSLRHVIYPTRCLPQSFASRISKVTNCACEDREHGDEATSRMLCFSHWFRLSRFPCTMQLGMRRLHAIVNMLGQHSPNPTKQFRIAIQMFGKQMEALWKFRLLACQTLHTLLWIKLQKINLTNCDLNPALKTS